jgi:hypothetical protein
MLIPTKHENLNNNAIVIGADVLCLLKKRSYNIEDLFQKIKSYKSITLEHFYNTLLFLWLAELIELEEFYIKIRK